MSSHFLELLGAVITVVGGALTALWEAIILWTRESLIPWFRINLPALADIVRDAFAALDRNLMSPLRAVALRAWRELRRVLLKAVHRFVVKADHCLSQLESFIVRSTEDERRVVRVFEETIVDWSELPPDVREQMLKTETNTYTVDVCEVRERELSELTQ
jgi:hypothetical protein